MRWIPWLLALAGIAQYALIAYLQPADYVTVDMAYLVMWLAIIGSVGMCYVGCGYGCCCDYDGCGCDHCEGCSEGDCCGKCACCGPGNGHEGHGHGPGEHSH